jgi:hypothetical protein
MTASAGSSVTYTLLGYVGNSFDSYDDAFAAAKRTYPSADAVVVIKGKADDKLNGHLFKARILLGYYAVKFKETEIPPRKKFLGIF